MAQFTTAWVSSVFVMLRVEGQQMSVVHLHLAIQLQKEKEEKEKEKVGPVTGTTARLLHWAVMYIVP